MIAPKALLLVEDEAMRAALLFALQVEGIDAAVCTDATISSLETTASCLVIDQGPKTPSPLERLEAVRRRGSSLPTIVLVSAPSAVLRARLAALGAMMIQKPLLQDELVAAIRAVSASGQQKQ